MIKFENVTKTFRGNAAVKNINIEINAGELVVLIGPSGCGKTTTLKMINKLIGISKGKIYINGEDITQVDSIKLRRNIGYVIQQTGLFPHMTVRENIEIISKIQGQSDEEITSRTLELMNMVGLEPNEFLDRFPNELSGGQQQRIGVARAFACDPDIILLDEPFSALDPITRSQLQEELLMIQRMLKKTVVFVTHDMDEAVKIADRICIMDKGQVVQYDKTEEILKHPKDDYVSGFVGENRIWSKPEFIKGEDIMITNPVTSQGILSVQSCINKMRERRVDSVLIVDHKNILLGIFTLKMVANIKDKSIQVRDVCRKEYLSVNPDNSIIDIMQFFYQENVNNIPVVDKEKHLCGLITSSSLAATLSEQYIETNEEDTNEKVVENEINPKPYKEEQNSIIKVGEA